MPFKVSSKKYLGDMAIGEVVNESDYAGMCPKTGLFVQMEYFEDDTPRERTSVKPGIFAIDKVMGKLVLTPTSFVHDNILEDFVATKETSEKMQRFFNRLHVYKEEGIEVPRRGVLLYGPAGSGKSTVISKVCREFAADEKTLIVIWHTDKWEPHQVKSFLQSFDYVGVDKVILVAEDIGGVEIEDVKMQSSSSLLSLLDNQERTFTLPTLIIATTNFPEIFMGNLTNRPSRFDDKIKIDTPKADGREALLKFYTKDSAEEAAITYIRTDKCKDFTPAHIKEARIRSRIYDKSLLESLKEIAAEIEEYQRAFKEKQQRKVGFGFND